MALNFVKVCSTAVTAAKVVGTANNFARVFESTAVLDFPVSTMLTALEFTEFYKADSLNLNGYGPI